MGTKALRMVSAIVMAAQINRGMRLLMDMGSKGNALLLAPCERAYGSARRGAAELLAELGEGVSDAQTCPHRAGPAAHAGGRSPGDRRGLAGSPARGKGGT